MELRYLILFVASAMLIACDAQTSTEGETDLSSSAPDVSDGDEDLAPESPVASAVSLAKEEMQKDAPAASTETTTPEASSEEKATTEAATTTKEAMIAPTRPTMKGTSDFPPLVHSVPTEGPKTPAKNATEKVDTAKQSDGDNHKGGSSTIVSSVGVIIVGLTGIVFRYRSY